MNKKLTDKWAVYRKTIYQNNNKSQVRELVSKCVGFNVPVNT